MIEKVWTAHLETEEEKEKFYRSVVSAKAVLDRLAQLIDNKENELTGSEISLKSYDNPNWAYRQAHMNGYRSCGLRLKRLLNLDPKETNDRQSITN